MTIDDNRGAREAVLARVRAALGRGEGSDAEARAAALAYVAQRGQGPRPAMPANLVGRFLERARDMQSSVDRVAALDAVPEAIARYLDAAARADSGGGRGAEQETAGPGGEASSERGPAARPGGVCWPEFATLGWREAGLAIESRPTVGNDALGITGCFCAIAETGTLVFLSGVETPGATFLLPETHVAVVRADQVVSGMEEAFAKMRANRDALPRAVNLVSGPSRTGDIEQTIVLGAHGPRRVHIVLVD